MGGGPAVERERVVKSVSLGHEKSPNFCLFYFPFSLCRCGEAVRGKVLDDVASFACGVPLVVFLEEFVDAVLFGESLYPFCVCFLCGDDGDGGIWSVLLSEFV